jgi:hypothetical protein
MTGIDFAIRGAADGLRFAAAPSFATMALLTGVLGRGGPDMLCGHTMSGLSGMVPMYLLMSVFHLAPWLKLLSAPAVTRAAAASDSAAPPGRA